jgi:hypothetical protein
MFSDTEIMQSPMGQQAIEEGWARYFLEDARQGNLNNLDYYRRLNITVNEAIEDIASIRDENIQSSVRAMAMRKWDMERFLKMAYRGGCDGC